MNKVEHARQRFLLALYDIDDGSAFYPLHVPDKAVHNPLSALKNEVWPRWQNVEREEWSNAKRPRAFYYDEHGPIEDAIRHKRADLLSDWARQWHLLSGTSYSSAGPAEWIVDYACERCKSWPREELAASCETDPLVYRLGFAASPQSKIRSGPAPPPPPFFVFPMKSPSKVEAESWREYRQRVKRALAVHFRDLEKTASRQTKPAHPQSTSKRSGREHFCWLILYQCCGLKLRDIRSLYPEINTDQAIWMGIQEKAELLSMPLRPKRKN